MHGSLLTWCRLHDAAHVAERASAETLVFSVSPAGRVDGHAGDAARRAAFPASRTCRRRWRRLRRCSRRPRARVPLSATPSQVNSCSPLVVGNVMRRTSAPLASRILICQRRSRRPAHRARRCTEPSACSVASSLATSTSRPTMVAPSSTCDERSESDSVPNAPAFPEMPAPCRTARAGRGTGSGPAASTDPGSSAARSSAQELRLAELILLLGSAALAALPARARCR